ALTQSTLKTISQLYFTTEEYGKALKTVKRLIASLDEPAADVYMLMGQAYFQMEDYKSALKPIKKAVDMYRKQGNKPKENWLLLLRVIYHKMEDFPKMLKVLNELVALYPKDQYLKTMAGVYSELGDTEKQLTIMEALYEKGLISSGPQLVNIANLYMMHGVPIKAAELLDKEINQTKRIKAEAKNYRLLSQAWYMSREDEKSIPPMAKAAEMAQKGELYLRLAQSHLNLDHYAQASKAIYTALKLGGLKRNDTANIMLGMALFNQNRLKEARKAFVNAGKDKRSRKVANQWVKYVDSELEREKALN
ncbi:MAG: tetratricopeptide repeat protein, partial [bacterium]